MPKKTGMGRLCFLPSLGDQNCHMRRVLKNAPSASFNFNIWCLRRYLSHDQLLSIGHEEGAPSIRMINASVVAE